MTSDEQEALSFRYSAPRVFILSSGNVAVCPMLGREPPRIYTPAEFSIACLPTGEELDAQYAIATAEQRARATPTPSSKQPRGATLEDLA